MPLLTADPVTVLPDQREVLEQLVRTHSTPQQVALRARIILHAVEVWACARAHESSVSGRRQRGIGASGGGTRTTSALSANALPMRRDQGRRRRTRPSKSARWWR